MHILDLPIVSKQLLEILLARFLVDVCSEYNPAFDRADRYCSSSSSYLGGRAVVLVSGRLVDVHLGIGHCGEGEWFYGSICNVGRSEAPKASIAGQ